MSPTMIEWLGYASSIIILISLTMSSVIKLRWINMAGALLFTVYGAFIGAMPVAVVNFGIVLIDLYYIILYYRQKESFISIHADISADLFKYVLKSNEEDIQKQIAIENIADDDEAVYLLRDNSIAGLLVGRRVDASTMDIKLDYVVPKYRDFKMGNFLFVQHTQSFKKRGIDRLTAHARDTDHQIYLDKLGFVPIGDSLYDFEKRI